MKLPKRTVRSQGKATKPLSSVSFGGFDPKDAESQSDVTDSENLKDEPDDLTPAGLSLMDESLANGHFLEKSFPFYKLCKKTKILKRKSGSRTRTLHAHRLKNRRFIRPQIYREVSKGGILYDGRLGIFLSLLKKVSGLFDNQRADFARVAISTEMIEQFRFNIANAKSEEALKTVLASTLHLICFQVMKGSPRTAQKTHFGARGILCQLSSNRQNIEPDAGFAGKGDFGVLSAKTGRLVVPVELKKSPINGKWLDFKLAQLLFNQGFGFMVGRNCEFLILATGGNYMLIWRVPSQANSAVNKTHKYYMYPNREYADFSDSTHLKNFLTILGELARISAFKPGEDQPEELWGDELPPRKRQKILSAKLQEPDRNELTTESDDDEYELVAECRDRTFMAESNQGHVMLGSIDLEYHLTPGEMLELIDMKKPPKEPED